MAMLLHELLEKSAVISPDKNALGIKNKWTTYQALQMACETSAIALRQLGLCKGERVAIYLPKIEKAVISYFSVSQVGGILIPVNPALKTRQVSHILNDSTAKVLVTNKARLKKIFAQLAEQASVSNLAALEHIIVIDGLDEDDLAKSKPLINDINSCSINIMSWIDFIKLGSNASVANRLRKMGNREAINSEIIDSDIAAIFYTSGSTGNAKGVVLSHRNLVMGAKSIAEYLPCKSSDVMAAIQPFSFDYGFSQLTLCFLIGASCYMDEYLFEKDLFKMIAIQKITTLALVPPLWIKLAQQVWPSGIGESIRYFCNTGGAMPTSILNSLRASMPNAQPYLMYGLTEAFRSCYLPPEQIDIRPESFGKAIPNAQISVINDQGNECQPHEHGELVHRGALVSQGYWNNVEKTAERFKPAPNRLSQIALTEIAVWSGDVVKKDEEGFLYFVGRKDDLIKTSGYRLSPDEVENVLYLLDDISEAIVIGVLHPILGQALIAIIVAKSDELTEKRVLRHCLNLLPNYMQPKHIAFVASLPRNANNKFDRNSWKAEYKSLFEERETENIFNKGNINENT
ncbi:MAG: acyl-CoA ligase (AMP-forming), exosortase A system-associated [Colwellia sp.]